MHVPVSLSVLSCYILIRVAVYNFYSCEIYWFELFTNCTSYLCFLLSVLHLIWLLVILRKNRWNKSAVQIRESTRFLRFRRRYYFRSGDHLRYNLGIISSPGIICGPIWGSFAVQGSFAGLYSTDALKNHDDHNTNLPETKIVGKCLWPDYQKQRENVFLHLISSVFGLKLWQKSHV